MADLTIHETVGDELEHLELTGGWILCELAQCRRVERDHSA